MPSLNADEKWKIFELNARKVYPRISAAVARTHPVGV
jgi:hypothetical protein